MVRGAHAPSSRDGGIFGALAGNLRARHLLDNLTHCGLSGEGAGQGTRGRVRSPFSTTELHRSS